MDTAPGPRAPVDVGEVEGVVRSALREREGRELHGWYWRREDNLALFPSDASCVFAALQCAAPFASHGRLESGYAFQR
jgi:hypothetical protein